MTLPTDYRERVYAGVLGKLIGVYLGRPFEGWTYERILKELGPIEYYVHERLGDPLVVTDDDVAGTFTFIRALEDDGVSPNLTSEAIGKAWLNYIVEHRSILWWGGNGNSTEHTAWLNLTSGVPAPQSGAIATNGKTVAEQIGAQIFIDGWAMVAPGKPELAARLARAAGSVSHDGESVYAAMVWAAMEAEAFVSSDINHLIDVGLSMIPADSLIARVIADIRTWHAEHDDWRDTRQAIADTYGYDKFCGNCHVVPNHALMIMAMLYAPDDFARGQMIVNTSGWDTDCNAGNVGCLTAIMLGLDGLATGPDWRGPIADRMLISSADGGNAINDAVRITDYLTNLGRTLGGAAPLPAPKDGAQFHFSLPGSTQGFRIADATDPAASASAVGITHGSDNALAVAFDRVTSGGAVVATTPVFASRDVLRMRTYELMATPLIYPGQHLSARVAADDDNSDEVSVAMMLRHYGGDDALIDVEGEPVTLAPGSTHDLDWTVPDCGAQPIAEIGLVVRPAGERGRVLLDRMGWSGTPELTLRRPAEGGGFWHRAWVNGASVFSKHFPESFHVSQDRGEGLILHGTNQWSDYTVAADVIVHLGRYAGLAARTRGLRRYYAGRITRDDRFQLVRVHDDDMTVLAETEFAFGYDNWVPMAVTVDGDTITATAGGATLTAHDDSDRAFASGGIGLLVADGAASANVVRVGSPMA
ncbi:MAG: ADP-ribosylglycohydrolase family protein [Hyphomicrobiales bacterium]|nr:ADP-ribosylglycohydrolase family protein [Hyphomicrobiales bacterium]